MPGNVDSICGSPIPLPPPPPPHTHFLSIETRTHRRKWEVKEKSNLTCFHFLRHFNMHILSLKLGEMLNIYLSNNIPQEYYFISLALCPLWLKTFVVCSIILILSLSPVFVFLVLAWIYFSVSLFQLIESYKNGGSLLIQGPDHCSLLHYAAKTGNGEIVKYILDHGK